MIYDGHVHLGRKINLERIEDSNLSLPGYRHLYSNTIESYSKVAKQNRIAKALCFPFPIVEIPIRIHNRYVMQAFRKRNDLVVPLVFPDELSYIQTIGSSIKGIKEHFYLHSHGITADDQVLEYLQQNEKCILVHAHRDSWRDYISRVGNRFPNIKIVIAHSARYIPFTGLKSIENCRSLVEIHPKPENLFFDTSTIRDAETIIEIINSFGVENVIWGSDYPYENVSDEDVYKTEIELLQKIDCGHNEYDKLTRLNFKRLFLEEETIREAYPEDKTELLRLMNDMTDQEKTFLALSAKKEIISKSFQSGNHIRVLEDCHGSIIGFIRTSDRPCNCALVEEIYIKSSARGQGYAKQLLESVIQSHNVTSMKTLKLNHKMIRLAEKLGFVPNTYDAKRIIKWDRINIDYDSF